MWYRSAWRVSVVSAWWASLCSAVDATMDDMRIEQYTRRTSIRIRSHIHSQIHAYQQMNDAHFKLIRVEINTLHPPNYSIVMLIPKTSRNTAQCRSEVRHTKQCIRTSVPLNLASACASLSSASCKSFLSAWIALLPSEHSLSCCASLWEIGSSCSFSVRMSALRFDNCSDDLQ